MPPPRFIHRGRDVGLGHTTLAALPWPGGIGELMIFCFLVWEKKNNKDLFLMLCEEPWACRRRVVQSALFWGRSELEVGAELSDELKLSF